MDRNTHIHLSDGPFSETTCVNRYQKGKTNLDFTEARESEWQWNPLGRMQVCISLQTDNHTSTPPISFLQAGCPSCRPTNSVKANGEKHYSINSIQWVTDPENDHFGWIPQQAGVADILLGLCLSRRRSIGRSLSLLHCKSSPTQLPNPAVIKHHRCNQLLPRTTSLRLYLLTVKLWCDVKIYVRFSTLSFYN